MKPVRALCGRRLVVISPHLDDAVLSIGATMAHAARRGVQVEVVTVFGGDPQQDRAPGESNRRAGFRTTGEAARARRAEDDRACAVLGIRPVHLGFDDDEASPRVPAAIGGALEAAVAAADVVLLPGNPLRHPDHRLVAEVAAEHVPRDVAVGLYLEQPYAAWQALSRHGLAPRRSGPPSVLTTLPPGWGPPAWEPSGRCPGCVRRKIAAMGAYRSQLAVLRRWPRARVIGHELLARGERVSWPPAVAGRALDGISAAESAASTARRSSTQ